MHASIDHVVIVGGGTAGWLTACVIAAHHHSADGGVRVSLIESSTIPTIGVGEGTWPTMKNTVQAIGIKESELFRRCHAAFKQGGKFVEWVHGDGDFYYHPFTVPLGYGRLDLAPYVDDIANFAVAANYQQQVCEAGLAPRTLADGEYQGPCNYAYHVDAGALGELLRDHGIANLGIEHVVDTVTDVRLDEQGNIDRLQLEERGKYSGDLFVDCTGFAARLLGKAQGVAFRDVDDVLFNDRALAMQVPYASADSPLACHTVATAQNVGWIWDIGLTHRRGVGHVYSSAFMNDDEAEANLRRYLGPAGNGLDARRIKFRSGHRERFWQGNCVAVGLSAGFVEPLEATAIMLVEVAARYIAENLPPTRETLSITAKRFNQQMLYRWRRIIDFLKLHYTLTRRSEPYWQAHADAKSVPDSLNEDLALWRSRGPIKADFDSAIELFPAASYQYVVYGMGFKPDFGRARHLHRKGDQAAQIRARNDKLAEQMLRSLPPHREYIKRWLANATH
ncbi:MAG: tryptophan halogenase family protein [Pseudomonadota bacterium]